MQVVLRSRCFVWFFQMLWQEKALEEQLEALGEDLEAQGEEASEAAEEGEAEAKSLYEMDM